METSKTKQQAQQANQHDEWFATFIDKVNGTILSDKQLLESGDAPKETRDFYNNLIAGDMLKVLSAGRENFSQGLIRNIVVNYLTLLKDRQLSLLKLALDISTNKILVWAEINDDDEKTEMALIRIESIINAQFFAETKIYLDSTIVENSDKLNVPTHYQTLTIN